MVGLALVCFGMDDDRSKSNSKSDANSAPAGRTVSAAHMRAGTGPAIWRIKFKVPLALAASSATKSAESCCMSASRVLHIPLSGRDRRHYGNELRKAQREHQRLTREAETAHAAADRALAEAHRLDCELWSTRLFLGGQDQPSPSIAAALHGGYELLEVQCRHCNHAQTIDLALVIWPPERPVHTIRKALYCAKCEKGYGKKRRPDLIGLRTRNEPDPTSPAAAAR